MRGVTGQDDVFIFMECRRYLLLDTAYLLAWERKGKNGKRENDCSIKASGA